MVPKKRCSLTGAGISTEKFWDTETSGDMKLIVPTAMLFLMPLSKGLDVSETEQAPMVARNANRRQVGKDV